MESENEMTIGQSLSALEEETSRITSKSTVQIFIMDERRPRPIGSGVLLNILNQYFLVSAAHVFEFNVPEYLILLPDATSLSIPTKSIRKTRLPSSKNRNDDKFDIAVCKFSREIIDELLEMGYLFVEYKNTDQFHAQRNHRYSINGFAAVRTKIFGKEVHSKSFRYLTGPAPDFDYQKFGFDQTHNIAVIFDGEVKSKDREGIHKAPNLEGISGCGLWTLGEVLENGFIVNELDPSKNRKLVGIVIEQISRGNAKVIVATNFSFVFEFIVARYGQIKFKRPPLI